MKLPVDPSLTWFTCSTRLVAGDDPGVQAVGSLRPPMGRGRHFAGQSADAMRHNFGTHGRLARWPAGSRSMKPQPQFLRIQWESTPEQGVTLTAILCLRHRQEIALAYASARGSGEVGDTCDLCEGRSPRPLA